MQKRISIKELEPAAYEAMHALESYSKKVSVKPILKELIKIRASQINKCAYCIDMHTEYALKYGETQRRIFLLPAWEESDLYSEEEKAALKLTEEITLISVNGVNNETYNSVLKHFGKNATAQLIMIIVLINSWNRIAVSTKMIYKNKEDKDG